VSDRRRSLFVLLIVVGLVAASIGVLATRETRLGLDLQGGVQLVYQGQPTAQQPVTQESLERALDIMRERVDAFGVSEPELLRAGRDQLEVNLPGVENAERAAQQVGTTAQLFFYDWETNVLDEDCRTNPEEVNGGVQATPGFFNAVRQASQCDPIRDANNRAADAPRYYAFERGSNEVLNNGTPSASREEALEDLTPAQRRTARVLAVPEGILVLREQQPSADAPEPDLWWIVQDDPALGGNDIRNPEQNFDQRTNEPIVTMEFSPSGARAFERVTRGIAERGADNQPIGSDAISASHRFAIALDNELVSTPYINFRENPDGIDPANGAQISGGFTIQTAQDLAEILRIGALPLRLELISRSQVSASLGRQALEQGLAAGIAGFAIVALFLVGFYRVLGVIATAALGIYALYFYALIELIPVTLTLPGIAGTILTLGVAADANIVIFERVKEEIRAGRSIPAAISAGYKKGFATILDANVVTLLVAFILFILATAGVRGFAFTLGLGTLVSLFTAVLATQAALLTLRNSRILRARSALGAGEQKRRFDFDFMGRSRAFFSMSGVVLLIGALAVAGKGLDLGIDFESGTRITAPLERSASVEQVRDVLPGAVGADAEVQTVEGSDAGENLVQISTERAGPEQVAAINEALEDSFGLTEQPTLESIGPTFGATVANSALIAIVASLLVIAVYIALRFEWKYAVPVLIALMHDLLITAGVYSLTDREVTTATVAALLTILGFSLYDTIIVFDRIRENVPRMPNAAFPQIVNRSMSEVIVRSLATSFCTLLPVIALFLFGGDTLKDFAFALIVGTLSGTYSSVFIASPVLALWKSRETVYRAREARIRSELGHVPAYAVAMRGAPVDVAPAAPRGGRRALSTQDPAQGVSRAEFEDLVANLGVEEEETPAERPAAVAAGRRPAGGRRAAAREGGAGSRAAGARPAGDGEGAPGPEDERAREGEPAARPKGPRQRRHGRPR